MCSRKPSILKAFFMQKMGTQQEEWKAVAECNGEYYVSNHGRVKSLKFGKERILKPRMQGLGLKYPVVSLCFNGKIHQVKIHKLVALAFISNPENKKTVNHKDGDKSNNHIDNLEWLTQKENVQHAWDTGLNEYTRFAVIKSKSKPVIDILNGKKYDSLIKACEEIGEPYNRHCLRIFCKSKLQRFFYITDGNR